MRDGQDSYWFLDAHTGGWHRFDGADWQTVPGGAPCAVEGFDGLASLSGTAPPNEDRDPQVMRGQVTPTDALRAAVQAVRAAYREGQISSIDAQALLTQSVLVTREGAVWTTGVQSGGWYILEGDAWTSSSHPPAADALVQLSPQAGACPRCGRPVRGADTCPHCGALVSPQLNDVPDAAYARALDFMLWHAGTLPEPITRPWEPPPGMPNVRVPHVTRQAPLLGTPDVTPTRTAEGGWFLEGLGGALAGQRYPLGGCVRIGREPDNDLVFSAAGVSRRHALVERRDGAYAIADLGSANGTRVNDQLITGPTTLTAGDVIALHEARSRVVAPGAPTARCPACGADLRPGTRFCGQCGARVWEQNMDAPLLSIVNGLGVLITLAVTAVTVVAVRKPRRVTAPAALISGLLSLAIPGALVALSGARLNQVIALPVLAVGALVGLIRGVTTRLAYRDGQVRTQTRGCRAALWGGSLVAAHILVALGSVLWAALGLIPLYLSTSNEVIYQGVLFVRRLFYKPPTPQPA